MCEQKISHSCFRTLRHHILLLLLLSKRPIALPKGTFFHQSPRRVLEVCIITKRLLFSPSTQSVSIAFCPRRYQMTPFYSLATPSRARAIVEAVYSSSRYARTVCRGTEQRQSCALLATWGLCHKTLVLACMNTKKLQVGFGG